MSLVAGRVGKRGVCSRLVARGLLATSVVVAISALSGCGDGGFRPLYGSALINGSAVTERLATVDIAPIPGRVGQRIRNELIFQTTGGGAPKPPQYRLDIAIRESVTSMLVAVDGTAGGGRPAAAAVACLLRYPLCRHVFAGGRPRQRGQPDL